MSYHWENVIWQSKDGSWNRGYFRRISGGSGNWDDDGYDSEWDDDFDYDGFDYLATAMASEEAARDFTPHGNPGSYTLLPYAGNSKECKHYDLMAHWHRNPAEKLKAERKEHLRKIREHFKALTVEWGPQAMKALVGGYATFSVTLKGDDKVYEQWGLSHELAGVPLLEGDWLTVEGKRVYNLKTEKFEKSVRKFERYVNHGRYGYRRF